MISEPSNQNSEQNPGQNLKYNQNNNLNIQEKPRSYFLQRISPVSLLATFIGGILVLVIVLLYGSQQHKELLKYGDYSVNQVASSVADEISATIAYGRSSILNVSASVTEMMDAPELKNPSAVISPLVEHTPFTNIEYIRSDGMNVMNIGEPFDASSREYFIEGIKGNTGIWNNYHPKTSKEVLINFYTPLLYEGQIAGVITGYIGTSEKLNDMLKQNFFGKPLECLLYDDEGNVIATSLNMEFEPDQTLEGILEKVGANRSEIERFLAIMAEDSDGAVKYVDQEGEGRVCVKSISETNWKVCVIVPASSFKSVFGRNMRMSILAVLAILLVLSCYLAHLVFRNLNVRRKIQIENEKLEEENRKFNEENKQAFAELMRVNEQLKSANEQLETSAAKQEAQIEKISELNSKLSGNLTVIQSMSKVYFTSFFVDLGTGEFYEISNVDNVRQIIGTKGNSQEALHKLCNLMVAEESVENLREFVDLSTVNERLKNKEVITCDYIGKVAGWCQLYMIVGDRNPDGTLKTMFVASRTIHDEKAREEKQRQEIERAKEMADHANAAKTTFLNNMSHDIRTPMNAILGYAKLMEKKLNNPDALQDYLGKIENSSEYLLELINNVLDVARIDSGKTMVDEEVTDFMDEKCSVAPLLENEFAKKNLHFSQDMKITHRYAYADMSKIRQIVMNLMSNAIKYTPEGGHIHLHFEEIPCEREGYATYVNEVRDDGIGISEEFLQTIFEPFTRARNTTESKIVGTGLGMAIVKGLVDLMGGTIEVESQIGKGSTFRVILSHRIVENPEIYHQEKEKTISSEVSFSGKRILLAEDNDLNAEIAIAILEEAGFAVERAVDGVVCIDMLRNAQEGYYDLILMDIQMPNMDGYKTTEAIRQSPEAWKANLPILAMTANAFEEDRKAALAAGMNGHLAKPIRINALMCALTEALKES